MSLEGDRPQFAGRRAGAHQSSRGRGISITSDISPYVFGADTPSIIGRTIYRPERVSCRCRAIRDQPRDLRPGAEITTPTSWRLPKSCAARAKGSWSVSWPLQPCSMPRSHFRRSGAIPTPRPRRRRLVTSIKRRTESAPKTCSRSRHGAHELRDGPEHRTDTHCSRQERGHRPRREDVELARSEMHYS